MKKTICVALLSVAVQALFAQSQPWADPSMAGEGKAKPRSEFVSYTIREHAEARDLDKAPHYLPLEGKWRVNYSTTAKGGVPAFVRPGYSVAGWEETTVPNTSAVTGASPLAGLAPPRLPAENPLVQYRAEIEVPYLWLDRDIYLHVEGVGSAYTLFVNGKKVGYSEDSRTPAEYNISGAVTDGLNAICIEVYGFSTGSWLETLIPSFTAGSLGKVYVYSQPKLCINDFVITTRPDSAGVHGILHITAIMSNSYRSDENITFGYDIYAPDGKKLLTYNLMDTRVPGESCDTLHAREIIYGAMKSLWTPQTPTLYKLMLYVRRDGRITEYIPLRFGFNEGELRDGKVWTGGKAVDIVAADYNAAPTASTTEKQLGELKKRGVNTICVGYPQPLWFYELCDRIGFYVIDQANINSGYRKDDRNVGGALANDRTYLPAFIDRVANMQGRSKNYACILATSMGGYSGNGYNFYKTYQWLKGIDSLHPVTYRDVQGEWNTDVIFPQTRDAAEILSAPVTPNKSKAPAVSKKAPAAAATRKR